MARCGTGPVRKRGGACGGNTSNGERGAQRHSKETATIHCPYEKRDFDKADRTIPYPFT